MTKYLTCPTCEARKAEVLFTVGSKNGEGKATCNTCRRYWADGSKMAVSTKDDEGNNDAI